jgi:hypothetical protein
MSCGSLVTTNAVRVTWLPDCDHCGAVTSPVSGFNTSTLTTLGALKESVVDFGVAPLKLGYPFPNQTAATADLKPPNVYPKKSALSKPLAPEAVTPPEAFIPERTDMIRFSV